MADPGYGRYLAAAAEGERDRRATNQRFYDDLALRQDQWTTQKRGIDYGYDKRTKRDAAISEWTGNLMKDYRERTAYDKGEEDWKKEMLGEQDISFWQMFGGGGAGKEKRTYRDWVDQYNRQFEMSGWMPGTLDYQKDVAGPIQFSPHKRESLMDLEQSKHLGPEFLQLMSEYNKLSPNKSGEDIKSILDRVTQYQNQYQSQNPMAQQYQNPMAQQYQNPNQYQTNVAGGDTGPGNFRRAASYAMPFSGGY